MVNKIKKGNSLFGKKPYLERRIFEYRLKSPKFFKTTGLRRKKRIELGKKLLGSSALIKPSDIARVKKELELGRWRKFRDMPPTERELAKKFLKGISEDFKEKKEISRKEFREAFKEINPFLPAIGKRLFSFKEREKIEKELFGKKPKAVLPKEKYERFLRKFGVKRYRAKEISEKEIVRKKIRILKKLGGI